MRDHDVSQLTASELERARRELAASLALARVGSPVRVPILARIGAIDAEMIARTARAYPGPRADAPTPDGKDGIPPLSPAS
jgi:hypothetical protein